MSCITELLAMKGNKPILELDRDAVIEGGGNYRGYEYLITFVGHGHRCGYVAVGDGSGIDSDNLCVHGDITFSDTHHFAKDLLPAACEDLWLGFDAAHGKDLACFETARKYFGESDELNEMERIWKPIEHLFRKDDTSTPSHKTYKFMEHECKALIDQIIEQRSKESVQ
jgi:hypothetical protein